ncbi:MAG: hypothetical protein ABFE13_11175 [Phycisphaerales bacterium]
MVIRVPELDRFYRRLAAEESLSHEDALRIFDALHSEAILLGAFSDATILDGLEVDLRVAKAVNGLKP